MGGLLGFGVLGQYLIRAAVMLVAIPFHEAAHALVSHLLGDDTAKNAGRLSLNPARHFDPMGALCMVLAGVGWAKPVGINAGRFKNPKAGMAVSAAAGPLANLLLAWVSLIVFKVLFYRGVYGGPVYLFFQYMVSMNISLAVFNLLPVPPFDGSRVALAFLPRRYYFSIMRYERYIMLAVFALVILGLLTGPLSAVTYAVWGLLDKATGFVDAFMTAQHAVFITGGTYI